MCYEFNIYSMRTEIEVGQKFGKWTVIDSTPIYTTGGQRNVKVQCECGKIEYKHWIRKDYSVFTMFKKRKEDSYYSW